MPWCSSVVVSGRLKNLGLFHTEKDAVLVTLKFLCDKKVITHPGDISTYIADGNTSELLVRCEEYLNTLEITADGEYPETDLQIYSRFCNTVSELEHLCTELEDGYYEDTWDFSVVYAEITDPNISGIMMIDVPVERV